MTQFDDDDPRTIVLEAYPEAKPFADLIQAETVEEYTAIARELANKVKNLPENRTQQPSPTPRNPKPKSDTAVSVEEAITAKSWPDYLHAKWEAAGRD